VDNFYCHIARHVAIPYCSAHFHPYNSAYYHTRFNCAVAQRKILDDTSITPSKKTDIHTRISSSGFVDSNARDGVPIAIEVSIK
jgi:hypothetical protein